MHDRSLSELATALRAREVSAVELARHFLDRIAARNPRLNAFITVTEAQAMAQAEAADARIAAGEGGPLTGVPIAHKDLFCTQDVRTTCASRMLENFIAPYDASVVERLGAAGCVMLGKTNMDEFAMGSSNENSYFGPVRNPWDEARVPGGSSGGSAAAVAARLVPGATGTDTGGSIRQPAALTGITGVKPTYGAVPRYGMVAFASSLDQGGTLTQSVADAALMLDAMCGFDPRDSTSVDRPMGGYASAIADAERLDGLKVGLPAEFFGDQLDGAMRAPLEAAIATLRELGATVVEGVSLANIGLSVPAYYVVAPAECSSNLSRFDGVRYGYRCEDPKDLLDLYTRSRGEGFGDEVKRRIMTGTYALSAGYYDAYYLKAQQVRQLIAADFAAAFQQVDVLLAPTSPTPAFPLGEKTDDPITMYLNDIYTIGVSLAGLPGMSVPCGMVEGLPVGLQVICPHFEEARMLRVGHAYQRATDHHSLAPEGAMS
ncbi:MAG: Asp-tRNA(Asn)/Glu-tRNA(Gln) amidotransferase subunit GatA [Pseudomonadota bacterium]